MKKILTWIRCLLLAAPLWLAVALLLAAGFLLFQECAFLNKILRLLISSPLLGMSALFAAVGLILWGLSWLRRRKIMSRVCNNGGADLTVKVGIDPLPWYVDLFQSAKLLPLLVGQHYKVRLTITSNGADSLRNVRMSLRMRVKRHGAYELSCEPVEIPEVKPHCTDPWYSEKTYLMHDTGGADLELFQAYADGKPHLTFEYQKRASPNFAYAYHVEAWRDAVLAIAISVAGVLIALAALAGRLG